MSEDEKQDFVLGNLCRALRILENSEHFYKLIPEVRINFVFALQDARKPLDVAAIPGRITAFNGRLHVPSYPQFGSSDHMARAMIEIMKFDPKKRAGINFKYTEQLQVWIEKFCNQNDLTFGMIDRHDEHAGIRTEDGRSMPWKIKKLVESSNGLVPNVFYENEALGKEPLFVLVGNSAISVAEDVVSIADGYFNQK
ncbi:MAG: thiamine-phosphate synthase family protein [Candidatus Helarchaeota archaeon]